jgi:hypothetical protein
MTSLILYIDIPFIPYQHDDHVWTRVLSGVFQPCGEVLKCLLSVSRKKLHHEPTVWTLAQGSGYQYYKLLAIKINQRSCWERFFGLCFAPNTPTPIPWNIIHQESTCCSPVVGSSDGSEWLLTCLREKDMSHSWGNMHACTYTHTHTHTHMHMHACTYTHTHMHMHMHMHACMYTHTHMHMHTHTHTHKHTNMGSMWTPLNQDNSCSGRSHI